MAKILNDADFSRRMPREHLAQDHDAASRPSPAIDQHVAWIHHTVLGGRQSSILDLGCGPGFYTHRFVKLGHACKGIDFGPASIDYARQNHAGVFVLGNVLTEEYGAGYDLVCRSTANSTPSPPNLPSALWRKRTRR